MIGGLLAYFVHHRTAANLVLALMVFAGVIAIPSMRAQYFPDVVSDTVTVSVSWPGAGAEDVDASIVEVLNPALMAVDGVTSADASASEGSARIRLEFEPNTDMEAAEAAVQEALDGASDLPDSAEDPQVRSGGWTDRVTDVVIAGPVSVDQLALYADEYARMLFDRGVTRSSVGGVAAPQILVEVPSIAIVRYDIGLSDISAAIGREVSADPAGEVEGTARIRTGTEARSAEEIAAVVLRRNIDGTTLTVGDVADVTTLGPNRDVAFYVGDDPAVQVRVERSAQGDAIAIQEAAADAARQLEATLPAGTTLSLTNSSAEQIESRLNLLLDNGLTGLALVVALLFLFLNARTALWVALGIPVAMAAAIALMHLMGITFNMISLFALILTLGIVVDDAIVVGEHADHRVRRHGESGPEAAEAAARRMFAPVFSATLTTIIAFYGLVVIGGRFGTLIRDIPWTVIAVLAASLVECFLILPNHLGHSVGRAKQAWYDWPSRMVNRGFGWVRDRLFRPLMAGVVVARYPVIALGILLLAAQAAQLVRGDVQWRFFSSPEQGSVTGNFAMLPAAAREDTLAQMTEMQRAVEALGERLEAEHGLDPVTFAIAQIGDNSGRPLSGAEDKEGWQLGAITVSLVDADQRPYSSGEFVQMLTEEARQLPLTETISFRSWGAGPAGDSIDIQLSGADVGRLKEAAEALKTALARYPEISGLEDSLSYDREELILELTPRGQALGFTTDSLGQTLRQRLTGIEAASYPLNGRSATVRVEIPEDELTADFLDRTLMRTEAGDYVPLADIVTVTRQQGFASIRRENGIVMVSVLGELADDDPDRAAEIGRIIEEEILPGIASRYGVSTDQGGLNQQEAEFLSDAQTALILTLAGIYLVLCWIFGSWTRPLVVMSIIPFGLVGAIWGHAQWDIPMSLFSVVGLIGMTGIIINDSIVLVTTIDEEAEGRGLFPAIIDGTADRLRPVFLTTATTVLGLAPLLYEGSTQAEFLKPTVVTLVYGLGFGMVLVLLLVPAILACQSDFGRQIRAARRALRGRAGAATRGTVAGAAGAIALGGLVLAPAVLGTAPVLPGLPAGFGAAFAAFLAGLALWLALIWATALVAATLRRRRTT
ncbi:efflux RND transporter permease subunit [Wenxinia saemankumensis]|uniref:efflux RND transporter permease subunit n=1 Tax=Wenxinia saemankumensis TaxID=1447782 RepID=UPI000934F369|nr:efflux RND transporter permease subunit [Wenxinia saemankumensis]